MPAGVTIQGLDKVLTLLEQLPKRVQRVILRELQETAREIKTGAQKDAPANLGRLRNSMSIKPLTGDKFFGYEVVAQTNYAAYLEFGTKSQTRVPAGLEAVAAQFKGSAGASGDPIAALLEWVKKKGISGRFSTKTRRRLGSKTTKEQEDRRAAFAIWNKIKKKGIRPQPYFFKQVPIAEPKLKKRVADIIQQII